jgi:hypothetical protein
VEPPPIGQGTYVKDDPWQPTLATYAPPIPFVDVTAEAGLDWVHSTGGFAHDDGSPSRYLPECMGPGVVLFDADGDGDMDIFVGNGSPFPGAPGSATPQTTSRFFRCIGPFRYEDATEEVGLALTGQTLGGAAADFDGDGDTDLLVTGWGTLHLMRNDGGRFTDATAELGLVTPGWVDAHGHAGPDWSTSAAWFDMDGDGDLDPFICMYARWCPANDVFDTLNGKDKSFAIPRKYQGSTCRLFANDSDKGFRDVTEEAGILSTKAKALGVALWDFNGDGVLDIVVANDSEPNFLYLSQGKGRFRESALVANIAYDEDARTRAGMGIDAADYLNDGSVGIPIGNFSGEPVALYRQGDSARFTDITQRVGISAATQPALTFGLKWGDMDLDGLQDIVLANGHLEPEIQQVSASITYRQPPMLLRNLGFFFRDWNPAAGLPFQTPIVGRGLALADLDGDGDLDLVISENGGPLRFLRNDQATGHHWLRVHLEGRGKNREAIGSWATLESGGTVHRRLVHTGSSYASQSEFTVTFGLGKETEVSRLTVTWPDGLTQDVPVPGVDRVLRVRRNP